MKRKPKDKPFICPRCSWTDGDFHEFPPMPEMNGPSVVIYKSAYDWLVRLAVGIGALKVKGHNTCQ